MSSSIERHARLITDGIHTWLAAEVKSSGSDHNSVLDDYDRSVELLKTNPAASFTFQKHEGHMSRFFSKFWPIYEAEPESDYAIAQIAFGGLMEISGGYRNQCYITSKSAEDYLKTRQKVIGIGISDTVAAKLEQRLPSSGDFSKASITSMVLKDKLEGAIDASDTAYREVWSRAVTQRDFGLPASPSVEQLINDQANWLRFVSDAVILAAKQRDGELTAVPFLDARSINHDPQVYYPFRGEKPPVTADELAA